MWWMWWKNMASTLHKESSACQVMSLKCLCWQMHYSWHPMSCSVDCDVSTWQLSTKSNLFLTRYTLECVWWKNSPKRLEFKKDLKTMARHGPFGTPCCDARLQYFRWPQPRISTHSHQRPSVWGKFYTGQYYATCGDCCLCVPRDIGNWVLMLSCRCSRDSSAQLGDGDLPVDMCVEAFGDTPLTSFWPPLQSARRH